MSPLGIVQHTRSRFTENRMRCIALRVMFSPSETGLHDLCPILTMRMHLGRNGKNTGSHNWTPYTGTTISRDRARRCIGEKLWGELDKKQVLECGCGAGRFTETLLAKRAFVTSIDLSEAVDANQENFPQSQTHRIAQADILQLPFAPRQFDLVFCLGVIQHTPNPEKTITSFTNR